jgi:hypothetical protein
MSKNKTVGKYQEEFYDDDYDFSEDMGPSTEEVETMARMISGLVEASQHQQMMAIELTKLAVEKMTIEKMDEEKIFSIFKQASKVVSENFPLKELWGKLDGQLSQ